MPCTTVQTDDCYINTTFNTIWLKIPHFSGIGPTTKTTTKGNFSISTNASEIECKTGCVVYINATNLNYTLSQNLQNITINNTASLVNNFSIYWYNNSNSSWQLLGVNGTNQLNYNLTLSNGSAVTIHQYRIDINKSKGATSLWNFTYFVSELNNTLSLEFNLTCTSEWSCGSWSTCISSERTRTCTDSIGCNGSTRTETTSCSSGSSSSGGSSSSTTSKTWVALEKDETATMSITSSNIHIRTISVKIKKSADKMKIDVAKLSSEPSSVNNSIDGEVYQYLSISDFFINNTAIDIIEFDFRVEKSWLTSNNVEKEDIVLMHYTADKWEELSTEIIGEDSTYVNYKATSSSFSYYAIAEKEDSIIVQENIETEEIQEEELTIATDEDTTLDETEEEQTVKESKLPIPLWSIITLALIFIIFVAATIFYVRKQRF